MTKSRRHTLAQGEPTHVVTFCHFAKKKSEIFLVFFFYRYLCVLLKSCSVPAVVSLVQLVRAGFSRHRQNTPILRHNHRQTNQAKKTNQRTTTTRTMSFSPGAGPSNSSSTRTTSPRSSKQRRERHSRTTATTRRLERVGTPPPLRSSTPPARSLSPTPPRLSRWSWSANSKAQPSARSFFRKPQRQKTSRSPTWRRRRSGCKTSSNGSKAPNAWRRTSSLRWSRSSNSSCKNGGRGKKKTLSVHVFLAEHTSTATPIKSYAAKWLRAQRRLQRIARHRIKTHSIAVSNFDVTKNLAGCEKSVASPCQLK